MDPLAWLLGLEQFGIKLGLHNINALLDALGRPERSFHSVHIAGTNGKGSVTAMVDAALLAAGHRSGRYTSPHLIDLTERFSIGGTPVDKQRLTASITKIQKVVERMIGDGTLQAEPTFFEVTTSAAFDLFRDAHVTVAVCEVGLGGRLDATNVLEPLVTAITSIGFDHERHLGNTLRDIAFEKAGIIKHNTPVVIGRMDAEARETIAAVAADREAELIESSAGVEAIVDMSAAGHANLLVRTPVRSYAEIRLGLAGAHQIDNAIVAIRVLEQLDKRGVHVPPESIVEGLETVRWPGRLEHRSLPDGRELLMDAAHNVDGAKALARFLRARGSAVPLVFAAMKDKDAAGMLKELAPAVDRIILTRASNHRSSEPTTLEDIARSVAPSSAITVEPSLDAALDAAWRLSPSIVVAGSIFLLGDVMEWLERRDTLRDGPESLRNA